FFNSHLFHRGTPSLDYKPPYSYQHIPCKDIRQVVIWLGWNGIDATHQWDQHEQNGQNCDNNVLSTQHFLSLQENRGRYRDQNIGQQEAVSRNRAGITISIQHSYAEQ